VTRLRGSDPKLREQLDEMQKGGYKVRGPLPSFTDICNEIIEKTQKQMTLDSLPKDT
jgi:hypothetical protein